MAVPAAPRNVDTHTVVAGEHFVVAVVALPADKRPLLAAAVGRWPLLAAATGRRRGEEDQNPDEPWIRLAPHTVLPPRLSGSAVETTPSQ